MREAKREDYSAWYGWKAELPEEGSVLLILGADAGKLDALHATCEVFELDLSDYAPAELVDARKSWVVRDGMVTIWAADGSKKEMRAPTEVELDLLEELTDAYDRLQELA